MTVGKPLFTYGRPSVIHIHTRLLTAIHNTHTHALLTHDALQRGDLSSPLAAFSSPRRRAAAAAGNSAAPGVPVHVSDPPRPRKPFSPPLPLPLPLRLPPPLSGCARRRACFRATGQLSCESPSPLAQLSSSPSLSPGCSGPRAAGPLCPCSRGPLTAAGANHFATLGEGALGGRPPLH